jgi:hypothetical protein
VLFLDQIDVCFPYGIIGVAKHFYSVFDSKHVLRYICYIRG